MDVFFYADLPFLDNSGRNFIPFLDMTGIMFWLEKIAITSFIYDDCINKKFSDFPWPKIIVTYVLSSVG